MAGVLVAVAATGDFESGTRMLGLLLRLAIICIFFRRAVRRDRMLWTTNSALLARWRKGVLGIEELTFEDDFSILRLHSVHSFLFGL